MERVETLSNVLAKKIQEKASINELLNTVKMLESELLHLRNITPPSVINETNNTAITISKHTIPPQLATASNEVLEEEKTIEVLQIDEDELEAELEEIKKNAAEKTTIASQNRPAVAFEEIEEIPTFANRKNIEEEKKNTSPTNEQKSFLHDTNELNKQTPVAKELNEAITNAQVTSINDLLKPKQNEVADALQDSPIKDLKKAIGINERFLYVNELFRGDEAMYEKSIKTINSFDIYGEAEFWIRRELKLRLGWDENYTTVKQFDQLVRRRFS